MPIEPDREKEIVQAALRERAADRDSYLQRACENDAELLHRVRASLREHEASTGPLAQPVGSRKGTLAETPEELAAKLKPRKRTGEPDLRGQVIAGRYKLLQKLGEGGMGEVWMAEQTEPVRRMVALKIIKAGMDSDHVLARFEAERQALAMMDHPNIAKVLDAGAVGGGQETVGSKAATTDSSLPTAHRQLPTGRSFFVMELVKGIPITKYCDQEHLTPQQRLELFIPICHAVQHAHQKGVIHRDLKPSNIMIALYDGKPVPKVIDFGIAKATSQKLTDKTLFTEIGQIIGTLEYMSPEQAEMNNLDIDTRTDVYALGVVLYELLTGGPPFTGKQLRDAGYIEMLRIIREVEPSKPSTKLSSSDALPSIAANRKLEPKRLTKLVSGDLDWIVMKCLEKERARRYDTANGLAMDIQRFLADQPVEAGAPSAGYRLRKFVRRNRGPVLAGTIVFLVLVAGIVGTTIGLFEARRQEQMARQEQARADEKTKEAERQQVRRALAQVDTLLTADPRAVPSILTNLAEQRDEVLARLREVWAEPDRPDNRQRRQRVALALLPVEPNGVRDTLVRGMLDADDPADLIVIRDALQPYAEPLKDGLWKKAEANDTSANAKLRILAALAAFDPDSEAWDMAGDGILDPWLADNPLYLGTWTAALRPVRAKLVPPLTKVFRGERSAERKQIAAIILADYAADQPETLAELIRDADDRQFAVVLPSVTKHRARPTELLRGELLKSPPKYDASVNDWKPVWSEAEHEAFAKKRSGAAVALIHLTRDDAEEAWQVLKHSAYPEPRTRLLHRLAATGVPCETVLARLEKENDVSIRRALILALGEYPEARVPREVRERWVPKLLAMYRTDPDAGIHSALDWLLRPEKNGPNPRPLAWGQQAKLEEIDTAFKTQCQADRAAAVARQLAALPGVAHPVEIAARTAAATRAGEPSGISRRVNEPAFVGARIAKARWYVTGQGQPMVVVPGPLEFTMGSPDSDSMKLPIETPHRVRIPRTFAIMARHVTLAEFQQFRPTHKPPAYIERVSPTLDCPAHGVTWYVAAAYCNWLSKQEGIAEHEWCYETDKNGTVTKLKPKYLALTGYRLPSEAEAECAARAGSLTRYSFGQDVELGSHYVWSQRNSSERSWPSGAKKPNDFGIFDGHGNLYTWCNDTLQAYPAGKEVRVDSENSVLNNSISQGRVLRGGSWDVRPSVLRSASRFDALPSQRDAGVGFRLSRTLFTLE